MGGSCAWLTEEEGVFLAFGTYYAKWARPWGGSVQTVLKIGGAIQHLAECLKISFGERFHRNSITFPSALSGPSLLFSSCHFSLFCLLPGLLHSSFSCHSLSGSSNRVLHIVIRSLSFITFVIRDS